MPLPLTAMKAGHFHFPFVFVCLFRETVCTQLNRFSSFLACSLVLRWRYGMEKSEMKKHYQKFKWFVLKKCQCIYIAKVKCCVQSINKITQSRGYSTLANIQERKPETYWELERTNLPGRIIVIAKSTLCTEHHLLLPFYFYCFLLCL